MFSKFINDHQVEFYWFKTLKPTNGTAAWKAGVWTWKQHVSMFCLRTCDSFIPSQPVSVVQGRDGGEYGGGEGVGFA